MSSQIIYDRQFIKLRDNLFVPIILGGASNCTEMKTNRLGRSYEVRERSWYSAMSKAPGYFTMEEMVAYCEGIREKEMSRGNTYEGDTNYSDKAFGWHTGLYISKAGRRTTYGAFKGLFVTGCKKALTVEQIREGGGSVVINTYTYGEKDTARVVAAGYESGRVGVKTSDELKAKMDEYTAAGIDDVTYVSIDISKDRLKRLRDKYFPNPKTHTKKERPHTYYLLYKENTGFLARKVKHGIKYYSYMSDGAKWFDTQDKAEKYVKKHFLIGWEPKIFGELK